MKKEGDEIRAKGVAEHAPAKEEVRAEAKVADADYVEGATIATEVELVEAPASDTV